MAASTIDATTDIKEMTTAVNADEVLEELGGVSTSENVQNANTNERAQMNDDDDVETFQDEPQSDLEADLHQKRHWLQRKEAGKVDVEMVKGKDNEMHLDEGMESSRGAPDNRQKVVSHAAKSQRSSPRRVPESEKEGNTASMPASKPSPSAKANGGTANVPSASEQKTRPKLKIPTPAKTRNKSRPSVDHKVGSGGESSEEESAYGASMDRLAALPALFSPNTLAEHKKSTSPSTSPTAPMTTQDLEICRRLDEEYERALEEREIGYNARYNSVRQSAGFSIAFMVTYMTLGTIFFTRVAGWELHQALFFAIYTITTVGYGSYRLPDSVGFQIYTIFYIFVGIATLTIMVAQVYQCIALEASRAQHSRDKAELLQRSRDVMAGSRESSFHGNDSIMDMPDLHPHRITLVDKFFHACDKCRRFLRDTEFGRGISVLLPFAGLIAIGAVVVGPIEGWSVVQSIYFAVVSLTTVGYGDFVPTKLTSEYFCIFWLPFSVGFMSLFLGNIAAFYIRLSDKNIQRLERQMRRRMQLAKDRAEKERAEVLKRALRGQESEIDVDVEGDSAVDEEQPPLGSDMQAAGLPSRRGQVGFESLPSGDGGDDEAVFGTDDVFERIGKGQQRRDRILSNSIYTQSVDAGKAGQRHTMTTMRDILKTVRKNMAKGARDFSYDVEGDPEQNEFLSMRSTTLLTTSSGGFRKHSLVEKKPSFALRVLVQERMAKIIAIDVAGFQSNFELTDNTLSVTIDSLPDMADKWLLPRRARKAFRTVAFEVLYFVGEHSLITRGADALFDLTPFEFHGLFSPLLAAMGDADTMERWLASTDMLASVDLRQSGEDATSPVLASKIPAARLASQAMGNDVKRGEIC